MKDFYHAKNIIVTGGAGFIGSHMTERLVSLGAQVTVIDDLSTGFQHNLAHIADKITFIHGSITDYKLCLEATRNKDIVFHLAAAISVPESMTDPLKYHNVNVTGTVNMLEACRHNNVKTFLFASSAAVYGPTDEWSREEKACNPQSPYGLSKLLGEFYCHHFAQIADINTVIVRYFNVWGARQNPRASYAAAGAVFRDALTHNRPITIYGDGEQTRDFVRVEDVVEANLTLAWATATKQLTFGTNLYDRVFNIASGTPITINDLVLNLREQYPTYSNTICYAPARPGDVRHSRANTRKYQQAVRQLVAQ